MIFSLRSTSRYVVKDVSGKVSNISGAISFLVFNVKEEKPKTP